MCAGPVWTLTGPSCGCQSSCSSPNLALVLSHTFWWRCHLVPVCSLATFSYADWVLCLILWIQCLFQAFKEVKRQILHWPFSVCMYICLHMFVFCVSCFVFFLSVLLLGSIVQFMHTLHSLLRGQLQFNSIQFALTSESLQSDLTLHATD